MDREREISLEKLREVGVLHPEKKSVSSDLLGKLLEKRARVAMALGVLRKYPVKKGAKKPVVPQSPGDAGLAAHINALNDERKLLQDQLVTFSREMRRVEPWGDFDPDSFAFLKEHGAELLPYELSKRVYDSLDPTIKLIVVSADKKKKIRALVWGAEIPGQTPFVFPTVSMTEIKNRMASVSTRAGEIEAELAGLAYRKKALEEESLSLLQEIEFETARLGMETLEEAPAETTVSWISGYVPNDKLGVLKRTAAEQGWALVWDDPAPEDKPPTLLRNNPMVRIVKPLFDLLGTIPGYREYDISLSYMLFLSIFFSMIIGDAVYGLFLFVLSFSIGMVFKQKSKANGVGKFPDAVKLLMFFSFTTVVWGSVTGSWFGTPQPNLPSALRLLILPPFDNTGPVAQFPVFLQKFFKLPAAVPTGSLKTQWNIQFFCFAVGTFQLLYARGKNVRKLLPSLTALSEAGWFITIFGVYFVVLFMLLRMPVPSFAPWLIGIGVGIVVIFSEQNAPLRNAGVFFINIAKGLTNLFSIVLKIIGCFGDIISYIRLFAVGLSGAMVIQTINSMAIPAEGLGDFGLDFIIRLIMAVLVLAIGHSLQFVMGMLSVVVHGLRLNIMEYAANHLGMMWSGYEYDPFALRQKKQQ